MFDPNLPANGSPNSSAQMRGQLTGLKDLIDALPAITAAQVDSVTIVNPGDPVSVVVAIVGTVLHFDFTLSRGNDGSQGLPGPPFASVVVDGVTTLNPGDNATVAANFDGSNVHFTFGIPRGFNGNDGGMGAQGPPGEVTNAQLNSAIGDTSRISNAVATLGLAVSDPPTQNEVQQVVAKLDELITVLRR